MAILKPSRFLTFNDKFIFLVEGKNKGHVQIAGLEDAYLPLDNIDYGLGNKIPLWQFWMFSDATVLKL